MLSLDWIIIEVIFNCFDATYLLFFPAIKCGFKKWVQKKDIILFWIFLVTAYSIINFSTNFSFISMYVFPALVLIYLFTFIEGDMKARLFWWLVPLITLLVIEIAVTSIYIHIRNISLELVLQPNMYHLQNVIIGKTLLTLFWVLIIRYWKIQHVSFNTNMFFVLTNVLCAFMVLFIFLVNNIASVYFRMFFLCVPIILYILNVYHFIYIKKTNLKNIEKMELQKKELKLNYYKNLLQSYDIFKVFRNEFNGHLQTIWANTKDLSNKNKSIELFIEANQCLSEYKRTGNDLLDIAICEKQFIAANYGIAISIETKNLSINIPFSIKDVAIVLDNLLDDAINILQDINDEEIIKNVDIFLQTSKDKLNIKIEYPVDSKINYTFINDTIELQTSPKDYFVSEFVKDIIDKYQGSIFIENKEYYLSIIINFPFLVNSACSELTAH